MTELTVTERDKHILKGWLRVTKKSLGEPGNDDEYTRDLIRLLEIASAYITLKVEYDKVVKLIEEVAPIYSASGDNILVLAFKEKEIGQLIPKGWNDMGVNNQGLKLCCKVGQTAEELIETLQAALKKIQEQG